MYIYFFHQLYILFFVENIVKIKGIKNKIKIDL